MAKSSRNLAVEAVWGIGLLVFVLGIVHCALAPYLMSNTTNMLMPGDAHAVLYMTLATGVATMFAGWMVFFSASAMREREPWAWRLAWRVVVFLIILGVGAVVAMPTNPFAHIMLVMVVLLIIALSMSRAALKTDARQEWPR